MKHRSALAVVAIGAVIAVVAALPFVANAAAPDDKPWERPPTNEEYGLLVYANMTRADPFAADGGREPPVPPMVWSDDLALAARYHSYDMTRNGCFSHNSCNGESWSKRMNKFYPGASYMAENISSGSALAPFLHDGWMRSPGHRGSILSPLYNEFGGGISHPRPGVDEHGYGTEDFGQRVYIGPSDYPMIPAGYIQPRQSSASQKRELLVNYVNPNGVDSVVAVVNGQSIPMTLYRGTAMHGTFRVERTFSGNGCQTLHFEARRGAKFYRWPLNEEILVGVNRTDCAERVASGGGGGGGTSSTTAPSSSTSTTTTTVKPNNPSNPVVTIDAPAAGSTVTGQVEIRAHATDDVKVKHIEVYVDGKRLVRKNVATVTRKWNAGQKAVKPGAHTILVKAIDDKGNVGTASITVTK